MSADEAAEIWRRRYDAHAPVNGVCPVCDVPKCQVRADAFADLIATDRFLGDTDGQPQTTAGGARRTA